MSAIAVVAVAAAALAASAAVASYPTASCSSIPIVNVTPQMWGYNTGKPITGATGSYSRGHGTINLTAKTVTGILCQVDRVRGVPDRQIILSVGHKLLYASHHAVMFGVPGNIMKISVRVTSTTDPKCAVGTSGKVTIFASYNGVNKRAVDFSFSAACKDHDHKYTGRSLNTNVPPN